METWKDLFRNLSPKWVLFSTATTGVSKTKDELIGVCACVYDIGTGEKTYKQLFRKNIQDKLLPVSVQFHQITRDFLNAEGVDDPEFTKKLHDLMSEGLPASYNTEFQSSFLASFYDISPGLILDTPVWVWETDIKWGLKKKEIGNLGAFQKALSSIVKGGVSMRTILKELNLEPTSKGGMLPLVYYCRTLVYMFDTLLEKELPPILDA